MTTIDLRCRTGSGAEAAIHAIYEIFTADDIESILLINAENAFNATNIKVMLPNISILCSSISTHTSNCHNYPSRLFVTEGAEIK